MCSDAFASIHYPPSFLLLLSPLYLCLPLLMTAGVAISKPMGESVCAQTFASTHYPPSSLMHLSPLSLSLSL